MRTMTEKQYFPASPVDELTYCVEQLDKNPLTHGWIFTLEGEVCSKSIKGALEACFKRYPKFSCTMTRDYPSLKRWFRYCWVYRKAQADDVFQEIDDCGSGQIDPMSYYIDNHSSLALDIIRQVPLRVILIRQPEQSSLMFVFHHAVADGIGTFFFIQQFIQFYEEIFYQKKESPDLPPDFKAISQPAIKFSWNLFSPKRTFAYLKYTGLLRKEPPAQLRSQGGEEGANTFLAVVRDISPEQFSTIRAAAKKQKASINDYLLLCMFQTIKKWNHNYSDESERFYITVPVNLRAPEDRTVGNIISGFNISLTSGAIGEPEETIRLIHQELTDKLNSKIAETTVNLGWFLKVFPLRIKNLFYKQLPRITTPTFSLSNLGIFSPNPAHKDEEGFHYLGKARISRVIITPPAGQWIGMVINTYNNRITFSMTALRSYFSPEAIGTFLDSFVRELLS